MDLAVLEQVRRCLEAPRNDLHTFVCVPAHLSYGAGAINEGREQSRTASLDHWT